MKTCQGYCQQGRLPCECSDSNHPWDWIDGLHTGLITVALIFVLFFGLWLAAGIASVR